MEGIANAYRKIALQFNILTNVKRDDVISWYFNQSEYDTIKSTLNKWQQNGQTTVKLLKDLKTKCMALSSKIDGTHNNDIFRTKRLRWIKILLISITQQIDMKCSQNFITFDEQSAKLYDTVVTKEYYNPILCEQIVSKLDNLVPSDPNKTLFQRYTAFRNQFEIDDNHYEMVYNKMLDDAQKITKQFVTSIKGDKIEKRFYFDINDSAEAWCGYKSNLKSVMMMNKARKITLEKCQQLTAHEGMHHIQFCLLDDTLRTYPEFQVGLALSPLEFILEGSAELSVDLIFPKKQRIAHLKEVLVMMDKSMLCDKVELLLEIDEVVSELWRLYTLIARDMIDYRISIITADEWMKEKGMKVRKSWPNVDFYKEFGSYMIGYGFGKTLIQSYLERKTGLKFDDLKNKTKDIHETREILWKAHEEFLRFPEVPSMMVKRIKTQSKL